MQRQQEKTDKRECQECEETAEVKLTATTTFIGAHTQCREYQRQSLE
jgi:hypothetical protein